MGKKGETSMSLAEVFEQLQLSEATLVQLSKWQMWTLAFHTVAAQEGLDCVEIRSNEESKSRESRRDAMIVKTAMPADWAEANRVSAQMVYVHAADTTRFFVMTFQERQGNKIEVKIEKAKKVPSLTEPSPPTIMKFIVMGEEDFPPSHFTNFTVAPWVPECAQITQFREYVKKEISQPASQQRPAQQSNGLFQSSNSQFFQAPAASNGPAASSSTGGRQGGPLGPIPYGAPDQIPTSAVIGGGGPANPYFAPASGGSAGVGQPYIIGDPTMGGPGFGPGRPGGSVQGNLIGPNSAIFQGGAMGGGHMQGPPNGGLMGPAGGVGAMGIHDPALMFHQPDGFNDLDPGLPAGQNPLMIGGVRRPGMQQNPLGQGGMFGPDGRLRGPGGGFGPGAGGFGGSGPGGNMFM